MKNFIFEYHRNSKRVPIGYLVAVKVGDNEIRYGYSLCCKKDKFDKEFGIAIAFRRAEKYDADGIMGVVPYSMRDHFCEFSQRSARYFKGVDVPTYSRELLKEVDEGANWV